MRALVTGSAGFIGSSLVDRLLRDGHDVVGVDSFTNYYGREIKERNLTRARGYSNFQFFEADLVNSNIESLFDGITDVFHLAGQPGVRKSWGDDFDEYLNWNVLVTQRLLEGAKNKHLLGSFVYSSSSSVYGNQLKFPSSESDLPQPVSPYGVSKLAAEHLCTLYAEQFGVPTVSLRYFTVYGPRQRPDMGISRIIHALTSDEIFHVYGDGNQQRDFTYIDDVVDANLKAATFSKSSNRKGKVFNVGGNKTVSIIELISTIEDIFGKKLTKLFSQAMAGDPKTTCADATSIMCETGWMASVPIKIGVENQIEWTRTNKEFF